MLSSKEEGRTRGLRRSTERILKDKSSWAIQGKGEYVRREGGKAILDRGKSLHKGTKAGKVYVWPIGRTGIIWCEK